MNDELITRVTNELQTLGIPRNISGFRYLRKAILLTYKDFGYVSAITTKLYPDIAKEFESSPAKVERAIRHSIELAYCPDNYPMMRFSNKPCNSLLIADIADRLRVEDGII